MKSRKKLFSASMALALGAMLSWSPPLAAMDEEDAPDMVQIDILANLYAPVEFDHAMHVEYAACVECHHHTTGTKPSNPDCLRCHENSPEAESVACSDCHTADRFSKKDLEERSEPTNYHIDKPGLKGAYHLNCVGCHKIIGGPADCFECHQYTEAGKKRFNTGEFAPKSTGHSDSHH
ncbi:MAG: cytochrome c3 family protein [Thermodesulfobacteriota bacterium]